jgi:hypothetical protein
MTKEQKPSSCNSLTSSGSTASIPVASMSPGVNNLVLRFTQKTLMPLVFDGRCLRRAESENRSGVQPANCNLRIPSKVILTFLAVRLNPSSMPDCPIEIWAITQVYRRHRPAHPGNYSPPERPRQMPAGFPPMTILDWKPNGSPFQSDSHGSKPLAANTLVNLDVSRACQPLQSHGQPHQVGASALGHPTLPE